MHLYEDQFSEQHDFPRIDKPSKVLIIASTARCGSHMLGHALQQTQKFGFPLEYANGANLPEWKSRLGISDFRQLMTELQQRRTSPNGVFGIKILYSQIAEFGGFDHLLTLFPDAYYVMLSRKNVLKQAVSLSIAEQTGVWISGQKPVNDNPEYSFAHIDRCLRRTLVENSSWRYKLAASGCQFIELNFNEVRKNLRRSVREIADFMGIEIGESDIPEEQVTKKQSNDRNKIWAKRFTAEFNKTDELLPESKPGLLSRVRGKLKRMIKA